MPDAVFVLWWITLIVVIFLVVPVVVYLLNRTYQAASDIRVYTAEILAAAQGIARNLEGVSELNRTPELAARVRASAAALMSEVSELERLVGDRR